MFLEYTLQENPSRGGLNSDNLGVCPTGEHSTTWKANKLSDRQIDPGITVKENVTFGMFKKLVEQRGWNPESLASELREIEQPKEFFNRVSDRKHADLVIPYRSVLRFYFEQKRADFLAGLPERHKRAKWGL